MDDYSEFVPVLLIFYCGTVVTMAGVYLMYSYFRNFRVNPPSWADLSLARKFFESIIIWPYVFLSLWIGPFLWSEADTELHKLLTPSHKQEEIRSTPPLMVPIPYPQNINDPALFFSSSHRGPKPGGYFLFVVVLV